MKLPTKQDFQLLYLRHGTLLTGLVVFAVYAAALVILGWWS